VWLALEEQFLRNRAARAFHLDAQFHQISGGLSVGEYCRQMKGMADSLHDLGEQVAHRTLVLNLLRGLSLATTTSKAIIKRSSQWLSAFGGGGRPGTLCRPGLLPALHLRLLVRLPPPTEVIASQGRPRGWWLHPRWSLWPGWQSFYNP
jgi:hypothetical protein